MLFKIKISKAKTNLDVEFDDLPAEVQAFIVEQGLSKLLNGATARETAATTPDEKVRGENAMALAMNKLDALKAGKFKRTAARGDGKTPMVVMTEARRLAKNIIKAHLKAQGKRLGEIEPAAITEAANLYLTENPDLIETAKASIEASAALASSAKVNVDAIPVSAAKVKANEDKKAKSKAATQAKNAGKPGPQASAVKRQAAPPPARRPAPSQPQAMH